MLGGDQHKHVLCKPVGHMTHVWCLTKASCGSAGFGCMLARHTQAVANVDQVVRASTTAVAYADHQYAGQAGQAGAVPKLEAGALAAATSEAFGEAALGDRIPVTVVTGWC
jgi:hypothetical protein